MKRSIALVAAAAMACSLGGVANAQKIDAKGKCHAADGKMAPMSVCKAAAAGPAAKAGAYKLDAKGNCHGADGKMVKKSMCAAAKG